MTQKKCTMFSDKNNNRIDDDFFLFMNCEYAALFQESSINCILILNDYAPTGKNSETKMKFIINHECARCFLTALSRFLYTPGACTTKRP